MCPPDHVVGGRTQDARERARNEGRGDMPKMKTHSGAKKRFRLTGTGKVMRVTLAPADAKNMKKLLGK